MVCFKVLFKVILICVNLFLQALQMTPTILFSKLYQNLLLQMKNASKTFVFEKEGTQQSHVRDYQIDLLPKYVDLKSIFDLNCPMDENNLSIYDPKTNLFITLASIQCLDGQIPQSYFQPNFILIRFLEKYHLVVDSQQLMKADKQEDGKDAKNKQRTIGQALGIVKEWRNLHLHGLTTTNKRMNLQQAANVMGISKKSLDDYYLQLRQGEQYHFDYVSNLSQKIGILRAFVKAEKPQRNLSTIDLMTKIPKCLKIMKYYESKSRSIQDVEGLMREKQYQTLPHHQSEKQAVEIISEQEQMSSEESRSLQGFCISESQQSIPELANQFFKGFDLQGLKEKDPYENIEKGFGEKYFGAGNNNSKLFE